jgi:hypothetical protein
MYFIFAHIAQLQDKYRITVVMKVKTDIITSITARLMEWAVIVLTMYVKTFKTHVIFLSVSHNVFDISLTNNFQHQSQSVDTQQYPWVRLKKWTSQNISHLRLHLQCDIALGNPFKDWSQFFFGSWRNKLKNVVHTV